MSHFCYRESANGHCPLRCRAAISIAAAYVTLSLEVHLKATRRQAARAAGRVFASSRLHVFAVIETSLCRDHAYFLYDDPYSNRARGIP